MTKPQPMPLRMICRTLAENDNTLLAFRAIWIDYKIKRLVLSKKRHNYKRAKLIKEATKLHNDIQVEMFKINLQDL